MTSPGPYVRPAPGNKPGKAAYTVKDENGLCATVYHESGRWEVWAQERGEMSPYWRRGEMIELAKKWEAGSG